MIIHDNGSNQAFNLKTDISQCVNHLLAGQYKVNILERTITPVAQDAQSISFDSASQGEFIQFMNDLCSISSISSLIRRDKNPSFFTFYINSLAKLEKLVTPDQAQELYKIFNIAYNKVLTGLIDVEFFSLFKMSRNTMLMMKSLDNLLLSVLTIVLKENTKSLFLELRMLLKTSLKVLSSFKAEFWKLPPLKLLL